MFSCLVSSEALNVDQFVETRITVEERRCRMCGTVFDKNVSSEELDRENSFVRKLPSFF